MVSLTELKKQLAREKNKLVEVEERKQISKELDMLKNPGKFKFQKVAKQTSRGFVEIGKRIGAGAVKLSKGAIEAEKKRQNQVPKRTKKSKSKKTRKSEDPFSSDFMDFSL